jgi:hypothetical protein
VGDSFSFDFLETFVDGPPDATWDENRPLGGLAELKTGSVKA